MAKYKAYPEYKDSGVEWIDSIPSHWDVKPTFALCEASSRKNIDGAENNVLSLSYGNIIPRDVETNFGLLPESFNTYQLIEYGDVILRLTDLQNDKNSLRVGLAKQKGIITSAYLKLKAKNSMNATFLYRLLHSYDTTKVFYGMGGGLRQSMKFEDFRRLPLLLPPIAEQLKISTFLDHETAKIDNLIEKQQQLIELLKEKRQAVISHAVTKGLNPDVPMKDSGVEWLGKVPENWTVTHMRHAIVRIEQGKSPECEARNADDDEWGVLKSGCVNGGRFNQKEHKALPLSIKPNTEYEVQIGDLIMSRASGSVELIGSMAFVYNCRKKLLLSDKTFRVIPSRKISPEFLSLLMSSSPMRNQIKLAINGAEGLANNITKESIKSFNIVIPCFSEQTEIINIINKKNKAFDQLEMKLGNSLKLLQERRTALISAAVTGKIDVRDWVAPDASDIEVSQEATA